MNRGVGRRRALALAAAIGAAGCSSIQTPYVEPLRFPLAPERPGPPRRVTAGGGGRRTILLRLARAAPGLEGRLLRFLNPDGTLTVEPYAEWTAPPAEAAEEALRRWLLASGLYAAVLAPGTRATADLELELELVELVADLGRGEARAAVSAVLLRGGGAGAGEGTVVAQSVNTGTAPLPPPPPGTTTTRSAPPEPRARAMVEALGHALSGLEAVLARHAGARPDGPAARARPLS